MMEVVTGDIWNYKTCKATVNSSLKHSNTQLFTDWMPFLTSNQQCENSEGKSIIFHGLARDGFEDTMFEAKAKARQRKGQGQGQTTSRPRPRPDNLEAKAKAKLPRGRVEA